MQPHRAIEGLNDPPNTATLAAADSASTATGTILIGTLKLSVVGTGLTLITANIVDMTITLQDGTDVRTSFRRHGPRTFHFWYGIEIVRRSLSAVWVPPKCHPAELL
jgi:hypothetical protein